MLFPQKDQRCVSKFDNILFDIAEILALQIKWLAFYGVVCFLLEFV